MRFDLIQNSEINWSFESVISELHGNIWTIKFLLLTVKRELIEKRKCIKLLSQVQLKPTKREKKRKQLPAAKIKKGNSIAVTLKQPVT